MTKDRPLIGLNMDYRGTAKGQKPCSIVPSGYYDAIMTAGGLPVLLPPLVKEEHLAPLVSKLHGLVLIGGEDLEPRKQGLPPHPAVRAMSERRENTDRALIKLAQQLRLPTLGVGAGMQLLNVVNGGTLFMHLPEENYKGLPHRDPHGGEHMHIVIMEKGTRMFELYGEGEIRVNSDHHQGVRKLAPCFRPGALAPDGLVEAFEHHDLDEWWCIGTQWHPENDGKISLDMQLLEDFVGAASLGSQGFVLAKAG